MVKQGQNKQNPCISGKWQMYYFEKKANKSKTMK